MRKDTFNKATTANIRMQSGYHSVDNYNINYAFQGFNANKYFTSDRYIKLDANFNRPDGKPLKAFGLEIEMECRRISSNNVLTEVFDKVIAPHFPADLFKYQSDGSLGGESSLEAITQVMSKEFIRNNYPAFKIMYDSYFPALGISSAETGNCGMHVNISNANFGTTETTQTEALRKLYYIINTHFNTFCWAFNRDPRRTTYCGRMRTEGSRHLNMYNMPSDHFNALNYSHYPEGRVEIRLVGGQSTFACFRNTMEVIFHLIDRIKTISWTDCDSLVKIFSGCNAYVYDRLKSLVFDHNAITAAELEQIAQTAGTERLYI